MTESTSCSETLLLGVGPHFLCSQTLYQTAIVVRYSAHIKPRKTTKSIKTQNMTHKHNMT